MNEEKLGVIKELATGAVFFSVVLGLVGYLAMTLDRL